MNDDLVKVRNFLTNIDVRRSTIVAIDKTLRDEDATFLVGARWAMSDGRGVSLSLGEASSVLGAKRKGLEMELRSLEDVLGKVLSLIEPAKTVEVLAVEVTDDLKASLEEPINEKE